MTLGEKIETARRRKRLTSSDLAAAAGVSRAYVRYIETDERLPSPRVAGRLADVLGIKITLDDLTGVV